jgi:hypothetical protein
VNAYVAGAGAAAGATAATTFAVIAWGDISTIGQSDSWSIDETNNLVNGQVGY